MGAISRAEKRVRLDAGADSPGFGALSEPTGETPQQAIGDIQKDIPNHCLHTVIVKK